MPLPAKLKLRVEFTDELLREIREELIERGTVCEMPSCGGQAVFPYRNDRSVMYVCEDDKARIESVPASQRAQFDKRLSETMYRGMLAKSFVFMNNESGFKLEELVEDFKRQVAALDKSAARLESEQRREIRRVQQESQARIGAPDDELMTGRQRQDLRRQMGQPTRGPERKTPTVKAVPTAHLVTHTQPPMVEYPAAEASLPFPIINLM